VSVVPSVEPLTLHIRWDNGKESLVNVSEPVNTYRFYAPLRNDDKVFRRVQVGEDGVDIVWPDGIEMSGDTFGAWRRSKPIGKPVIPATNRTRSTAPGSSNSGRRMG
jgi:Protein of unknown function (DUF2442)